MSAARPALVMFDFDGTLADTFPVFRDVFDEVIDRYRLRRPNEDDVHALRGMRTADILRWLEVPAWRLPAIMRFARARMRQRATDIALFPGMAQLVDQLLDAGVLVAVVSSNSELVIRTALGEHLAARVQAIRGGVGLFGKSARLRGVMRQLGVTASDSVMVGDEERDITAAHETRVRAIAVTWGYAAESALSGAEVRCGSVDALGRVLGIGAAV